ncbi:MAG: TylF/MycF family methyltransferase [Candidatus Obscuribacterales bacterium]|nr:TylF/MycF family methyltransferase [Candidatus Obscuribacterales bacterium]
MKKLWQLIMPSSSTAAENSSPAVDSECQVLSETYLDCEYKTHLQMAVEHLWKTKNEGDLLTCGIGRKESAAWLAESIIACQQLSEQSAQIVPPKLYLLAHHAASPELIKRCQNILPPEGFVAVRGFFPQSIEDIRYCKFRLIHLDSEIVDSTNDILENLFAKGMLMNGSMIMLDGGLNELDLWTELAQKYSVQFVDLGSYGASGRKFLIHSYEPNAKIFTEDLLSRFERSEIDKDCRRQLTMAVEYLDGAGVKGGIGKFGLSNGGKVLCLLKERLEQEQEQKLTLFVDFRAAEHLKPMFGLLLTQVSLIEGNFLEQLGRISPSQLFRLVHIEEFNEEQVLETLSRLLKNKAIAEGAIILLDDGVNHSHFCDLVKDHNIDYEDLGTYAVRGRKFLIRRYNPVPARTPARDLRILSSFERTAAEKDIRKHLILAVEYIYGADVNGDIAEFGTCEGRTAAWLADAISSCEAYYGPQKQSAIDARFDPKRLYLFDSFEGLPDAVSTVDLQCPHVQTGVWGAATSKALNAPQLRSLCEKFMPGERIEIIEGWYSESMKHFAATTKFSLLHIDCDLYQSTMEVLDVLFDKELIAEGAAILFDDWNPNRASPGFGERKAWSDLLLKYEIEHSNWGSYGWGGQKFLIHSYRKRQ